MNGLAVPGWSPVSLPTGNGPLVRGRDESERRADAARQFEALLLEHLLKTMREAGKTDDEKEESFGRSETYIEIAEQQMARVLAERGGLGLARLVERGLAEHRSD